MKKTHYYTELIHILKDLHKCYPTYNMGRHLATALDGYGDIWGITDKELFFSLEKYKAQLDMDVPHTDDGEIDVIVKQGMNLESLFNKEEEDY